MCLTLFSLQDGEGFHLAPIQTSLAPEGAGPGHRLVFGSGREELEKLGGAGSVPFHAVAVGGLPASWATHRPWAGIPLGGVVAFW